MAGRHPARSSIPRPNNDLFYTSGPNPANLTFPSYLPDVTNNPLHGFEAAKNPNLPDAGYAPQDNGGMPADQNVATGIPDAYPTYDLSIRTNGLNEADEMNLYRPNPLLDSPYGPPDLEWLYRSQDVDGPSLLSRLADLAPVSFTNTIDGQRRRRLFAVESWESNKFVWANDNPQNAFPFNSRFAPTANASFATASTAITPARTWRLPPWPTATRRSTSITPCRSRTTPTSRSGRSGSPTRISSSSGSCPPGPSILRKSWPSSASS